MSTYTKAEVDSMISNLITRINTATGTLNTTKNAISSHNTALDAHNVIISTKADLSTVNNLSGTVGELTERIINLELENKPVLDGTLNYSVFGKAAETDVAIAFDIEPIDENNPVTYEPYGDGTLIAGLTFDAAAGTISGQPIVGGTASYTVLAKSGSYGVFITILQSFEDPDYIPVPGHEALNELIAVLRSNDISSLSSQLGVPITIKVASGDDYFWALTYEGSTYTRAPGSDITDSAGEITLFAWSSGSSTIYTSEVAIFGSDIVNTGESIKNSSGDVIGVLETTPSYMKDYRIMMTSYDTDTISDSNKPTGYAHNARMEFLDSPISQMRYGRFDASDNKIYESSTIRKHLTSNTADGFLRRIPVDIRNLIVPTDIKCVPVYAEVVAGERETYTLTDKVFVPSACELGGKPGSTLSPFYIEGTKSLYYPVWSNERDDTRIRYNNGSAVFWWTRSAEVENINSAICVGDDGRIFAVSASVDSIVVAPAFVIA